MSLEVLSQGKDIPMPLQVGAKETSEHLHLDLLEKFYVSNAGRYKTERVL